MSDHEDAWTAYMNIRWGAPDCTACDQARESGATVCSGCGMPIEQGKPKFWVASLRGRNASVRPISRAISQGI